MKVKLRIHNRLAGGGHQPFESMMTTAQRERKQPRNAGGADPGCIEAGREPGVRAGLPQGAGEPTLDQKVDFLGRSDAYPHSVTGVIRRETHMSWVFLAGDRAYKLKKPVRFPYLDFSTLGRREAACRAELSLNRRLAPDIYLDVLPLTATPRGLTIGGQATIVDWLVVMRRLDEGQTLEHAILEDRLEPGQLDRLVATLVQFYRRASRVSLAPAVHLHDWRQSLAYNLRVLLEPRFALPAGLIRRVASVQHRFLSHRGKALAVRVIRRCIVDGHGDLRPEHIWLGDPVRIIDCLEFNPRLRAVDPFDEIAFLSLECGRLGAAWAGEYIRRRVTRGLRDGLSDELFLFYRCSRAMLRARLAIAHLMEPHPRTPEKWPRLARAYLAIATADAVRLERSFKIREGRPRPSPRRAAGSFRRAAAPPAVSRPCRALAQLPAGRRARHR
jgi:aminoglycoside phosphotransferase family enzyme